MEIEANNKAMTFQEKVAYGGLALALASSVHAEGAGGGFGDAATGAIEASKTDLTTVGIAVIGVAALIFGIKIVKRLIGG